MNLDLGGPGPGCSATRVRRLAAGELTGAEKERAEAHVAQCARCAQVQAGLQREQEQLRRDVPFPVFAAGVAEKLAQRPQRSRVARWVPLAAAAGLALVAGALVLRPADDGGIRSKGGLGPEVFVQDSRGTRELQDQPLAPDARILVSLHPGARRHAAVVLIEDEGPSVIYSGPALNGPLPQAFEWTGKGRAELLIVVSDQPVDAARLRSAADAPRGAEVTEMTLRR